MDRPASRQPIPEDARQVFVGQLFEVYQWQQPLFDGSTATFEKLRRPDTAYVLPVTKEGHLTIVRQRQPGSVSTFGLIGGRVASDESPDVAARRELQEEAGLSAGTLQLWDSFQFLPKIEWAIYIFIARDCRPIQRALDAGEDIDLVDLMFDELIKLAASEEFGDVEVALRLLRIAADPTRLADARHLLLGYP